MEPKAVMPHGDVLHDIGASLRTGLIVPPVNSFRLQLTEEAFNNAVIPTVAFSTHAPQNTVGFQKPSGNPPIIGMLGFNGSAQHLTEYFCRRLKVQRFPGSSIELVRNAI